MCLCAALAVWTFFFIFLFQRHKFECRHVWLSNCQMVLVSPSELNSLLVFSQDMEGCDLDMLAPYISMDDDFQLTFLSSLPEDAKKLSSSPCEPSAVSRKR